jgi:hypothetical protein
MTLVAVFLNQETIDVPSMESGDVNGEVEEERREVGESE